jgi:hypothetical protein
MSKNHVSYPCLHVAWEAISALYGCNPRVLKKHGSPSECDTVLSADDDIMLSGTYKITEDSNTDSHHNENLKSFIYSMEDDLNKLLKL